jgi:glutamate racemase
MSDPRPIGVFDSGVGGLTVLRQILRRMPAESTIYLGDNARAPYGPRSDEEVLLFSRQAIERLAERDVKAIVIACNTSTAIALADLRRRHDLPILGVIRPGAVTAALSTRTRRVGVIATTATVRSHAYFNAIKEENPAIEVYEHATPALVPLVEAGKLHGPLVEAIVRDELAGLLGERDADGLPVGPQPASASIDTLLLGCTHYPLIEGAIRVVAGERIAMVDSATATAGALDDLLAINGLEAPGTTRGTAADPGHFGHDRPAEALRPVSHRQLTTGSLDAFRDLAGRLFGEGFVDVEAVALGVPVG